MNKNIIDGTKIKVLRLINFLLQEELADQLGVSHDAIARWEDGSRNPNRDNFKKICEYFNVPAEFFLIDKKY